MHGLREAYLWRFPTFIDHVILNSSPLFIVTDADTQEILTLNKNYMHHRDNKLSSFFKKICWVTIIVLWYKSFSSQRNWLLVSWMARDWPLWCAFLIIRLWQKREQENNEPDWVDHVKGGEGWSTLKTRKIIFSPLLYK